MILREICNYKIVIKTSDSELPICISNILLKIENYIIKQKEAEKLFEKRKQIIHNWMIENNKDTWNTGNIVFNNIKEGIVMSFDSKRFEKEHPALYKAYYTKETKRKSYLTTKLLSREVV